jgi:hypothetical protein
MTMEVSDFAGREKTTTLRVMTELDPMDVEPSDGVVAPDGDTGAP